MNTAKLLRGPATGRSRATTRSSDATLSERPRAHAAAVIKSYKKGDQRLADIVYSGVPAGEFGLEQVIEIGPMSGKSNVIYWLEKRGIAPEETLVNRIFEHAKSAHGVLEESEILRLVWTLLCIKNFTVCHRTVLAVIS